MVKVVFLNKFQDIFSKIKDNLLKEKIIKQIRKIKLNPKIGKPMRYDKKGSRELYIPPFRLSYLHNIKEEVVYILDLYHKKNQ